MVATLFIFDAFFKDIKRCIIFIFINYKGNALNANNPKATNTK